MLRCGRVAPARILRAARMVSLASLASSVSSSALTKKSAWGSAILGAECNSDLIGEFLERSSVRGEQWRFLEKVGGIRQVGERALLAFGDGRTLCGKTVGEQENLAPALVYSCFHLLRFAKTLTEQVQVIGESTHGIKKLFVGLRYAKCV